MEGSPLDIVIYEVLVKSGKRLSQSRILSFEHPVEPGSGFLFPEDQDLKVVLVDSVLGVVSSSFPSLEKGKSRKRVHMTES